MVHDSRPEYFYKAVQKAVEKVSDYDEDKKIIFIKSWNEWAEGNYLEPDQKWGTNYLNILKKFS